MMLHTLGREVELFHQNVVLEEGVLFEMELDPVSWFDIIEFFHFELLEMFQAFFFLLIQDRGKLRVIDKL